MTMESGDKKDCLAIVLLIFLNMILFHRFVFSDTMIYPSVEAVRLEYFWDSYLKDSLLEGAVPLWDININSGVTYVGMPTHSMFFPLNFLYLIMPVYRALGFNIILDVILAGVFSYVLARTFGLGRLPSLLSAATYMWSGTIISQIFGGNISQINAMPWLPLIIAAIEIMIRKGKTHVAALGGLAWGVMILSGHLQYPVYGIFLVGVYVLARYLIMGDKNAAVHIKALFLVVVIGIFVSAVRLLPVLEFATLSTRSSGLTEAEASQDSMPFIQTAGSLIPDAFGNHIDRTYWGVSNFAETNIYVGFVPLVLAAFAFVFIKNKPVKIFSVLGALSLLLMFGKFTPVFDILINIVKPLGMFKTPVRFAFGFVMSVSLLAGFGYEALLKNRTRSNMFAPACFVVSALFMIAIAALILVKPYIEDAGSGLVQARFAQKSLTVSDTAIYEFYYSNYRQLMENYYGRILENLAVLAACAAGMALFFRYRFYKKPDKIIQLLPIILAVLSLMVFGYKFSSVEKPENVFYTPGFVNMVKDSGMNRVLASIDILPQHIAAEEKIMLASGWSEMTRDYAAYVAFAFGKNVSGYSTDTRVTDLKHPAMMNNIGVKYFIFPKKLDGLGAYMETNVTIKNELHRISYNKTIYIYKNDYAKPKIFLTNRFIVSQTKNPADILDAEENEYIVVDAKPSIEITEDLPIDYNVTINKYEPNRIEASVYTNQNSILVLGDAWYPGWYAAVDGKKVSIMKADTVIRAVELPKGDHEVSFGYEPASLSAGLLFTIVGLSMIVYIFYKKV